MIFYYIVLNFVRFWGYYLGRSVRGSITDISVRKPCWSGTIPISHQARRWRAYGCPQASVQSISNPVDIIFYQLATLYELMMPVTDVL